MNADQLFWIVWVVVTLIFLNALAALEKKWIPIYPGSGEEPADYKEVPVPDEDEEHEE